MSESDEEDRTEVVSNPPSASTTREVIREEAAPVAAAPVQRERVIQRDGTVPERREARVVRTRTNSAAIIAIVIGVIVLVVGIYLVLTLAHNVPAPYSYLAVFIIGIILIAVGAKLVTTRTSGI